MGDLRRDEIVAAAKSIGLPLVEDNPYGEALIRRSSTSLRRIPMARRNDLPWKFLESLGAGSALGLRGRAAQRFQQALARETSGGLANAKAQSATRSRGD